MSEPCRDRSSECAAEGPPSPPRRLERAEFHRGFRVRHFRRAPWLRGSHAQTVVGKYLRSGSGPALSRERVRTPDDDFLDLDVAPDPGPDRPLVVILHGLEGSSKRAYVRTAMRELAARGMFAVALNFRSCSGEPNLRPRLYHSGETGDPAYVLDLMRERFPRRPIGILGFSLGGNVLLKYLGERGSDARRVVDAAATISVPFDLVAGTQTIESGIMGRVYTHYFLRSLRGKADAKAQLLADLLDLDRVRAARTLREFDEVATAPLHGFLGAEAYYRASSSAQFLPEIRVPTLLLQSRDDPFLPEEALPDREVAGNPFLLPAFTDEGGHVGFVEGAAPWRASFWAEEEAARYLQALLART